jgi:hypothetical protein
MKGDSFDDEKRPLIFSTCSRQTDQPIGGGHGPSDIRVGATRL